MGCSLWVMLKFCTPSTNGHNKSARQRQQDRFLKKLVKAVYSCIDKVSKINHGEGFEFFCVGWWGFWWCVMGMHSVFLSKLEDRVAPHVPRIIAKCKTILGFLMRASPSTKLYLCVIWGSDYICLVSEWLIFQRMVIVNVWFYKELAHLVRVRLIENWHCNSANENF